MIIAYARVSTDGQTLDAQRATLKAAGVERTYAEKISGAKTNRRQLQLAIEALGVGDVCNKLSLSYGTVGQSPKAGMWISWRRYRCGY